MDINEKLSLIETEIYFLRQFLYEDEIKVTDKEIERLNTLLEALSPDDKQYTKIITRLSKIIPKIGIGTLNKMPYLDRCKDALIDLELQYNADVRKFKINLNIIS